VIYCLFKAGQKSVLRAVTDTHLVVLTSKKWQRRIYCGLKPIKKTVSTTAPRTSENECNFSAINNSVVSPCLLYCADAFLCCPFRTYVNSAPYNLCHSSGSFNELSIVSTYIYHTVVSISRKSALTHITTILTIAASNCATPVLQSSYIAIATAG
jgi:hypothetical protein